MTTALAIDAVDGQAECLTVEAMATRFELVYWGPRAAGEEALAEIARLDARLSTAHPASDVSWINSHAGLRAVKVEPRTFTLLQRSVELAEETDGAFDITVGPLLQAWKFAGDTGAMPSPDMLADARVRVGYHHLHLNPRASTIRFGRSGMRIDFGAAGRGYAIDAAITVLQSHGVRAALLRGGTSSVHAIGEPPQSAWTIAWAPDKGEARTFTLHDDALSMSAMRGQSFTRSGQRYGHVFDPILGLPAAHAQSAVVTGPCSLECAALSTALLVLGADWIPALEKRFPGYSGHAV